jgi:hypothetical protein
LQFDNNGGLCPFIWQDLTVFGEVGMAESCQKTAGRKAYLGSLARPWRNA